jgi:peroxiredoxin
MNRTATFVLLATLAVAAPAEAQKSTGSPSATPPEAATAPGATRRTRLPGIAAIGERAPDFELDASNNTPVKLSRMRGDWVLLAFADRKEDLASLASIHTSMRRQGVQILGVCNEKAHNLRSYTQRQKTPFLLLADVTGEVSAMYGVYDYLTQTTLPGFLVLDREGDVRLSLMGSHLPAAEVERLVEFVLTPERAAE